jgi:hypothetical protein
MLWLVLIGLAALAFGGPIGGTPAITGETPKLVEWVENGIHFAWDPATRKLSGTLMLPDGAVKVHEVGTYDTAEAAALAAKGWLPPPGPVVEPGLPKPPVPTPDANAWVDHGIAFSWAPGTGELTAKHSVGVAGGTEPTTELVGTYPTREAAHLASLSWVPFGAGEGVAQPQACETIKADGPYSICLYKQNGGYGYRALDGAGATVATGQVPGGTQSDALLAAWQMLLPYPVNVVPAPSTKHGATLEPNGTVKPADLAAFKAYAIPVLQAQIAKGETDPAGLVLHVLGSLWPAVNLLRLQPNGKPLGVTASRIAPHVASASAVADRIFVLQAGIATPPPTATVPPAPPSGPVVQIDLGPNDPQLLQHVAANGAKWWIVTTYREFLSPTSGEPTSESTWRVWGPDAPVVGAPVAASQTGARPTSIAAAKTWIETH